MAPQTPSGPQGLLCAISDPEEGSGRRDENTFRARLDTHAGPHCPAGASPGDWHTCAPLSGGRLGLKERCRWT